jgi:hypothetical protein
MSYMLIFQLMAWHSSAGYTFMVEERTHRPHSSVQRRKACIFYYNKLSDEIVELQTCKLQSSGRYWTCSKHKTSTLGHDARIQRLRQRQTAIQRKINQLGRETERLTRMMPC